MTTRGQPGASGTGLGDAAESCGFEHAGGAGAGERGVDPRPGGVNVDGVSFQATPVTVVLNDLGAQAGSRLGVTAGAGPENCLPAL